LARLRRSRYVDTGEASKLLDGMISAARIRKLAMEGGIQGAVLVGGRQVLIPRASVDGLVVPLDCAATSAYAGTTRLKTIGPLAV
jgi:hypothetical protein